ncbi:MULTISPECIES: ATPase, T2SS/T4P/T4SS family [unclassified Pseudomonas]|uniref:ATPase, T2SS/T4P/T4SS family n=1 Tax=unclassified Pseudomonas TaxID=196821 RepID=UPI001326202D|nr:twitching motility protein PilT [Pseudomonas sp. FSL R10-0765]MQT53290.1 twitching motility protein PilT [Pseudomonas sp. FSL R10-2398]MQU02712.1 twitching motility protein PilT [Pseudomonas sp. FSL R10-2245]MQU13964.1 twitching motility protein PilT [Pseudomonas sp. FSL R10-2189]MQU38959.1 twitching motility protein PilT [Pseudomonas sp. FSL R10-2172]
MSVISEAEFVDLYLGDGFADVKGLPGSARRVEAPCDWRADLERLRMQCIDKHAADPEFALIEDGVVLRVTQLLDLNGKPVFVLSKSSVQIRPLDMLGLPDTLQNALMTDTVRGLIFICGEMGTGKTSSAASLVKARLETWGGLCLAVEDPPEPFLHGLHGQGRCIQVPVCRRLGGYEEALILALRTRADLLFVGEIRDSATAAQVIKASINGHLIISTGHAGSVIQGIERICALAHPLLSNARELLSEGLVAVIQQSLSKNNDASRRLTLQTLLFTGADGPGIREKVRAGKVSLLDQDIVNQSSRSLWNDQ